MRKITSLLISCVLAIGLLTFPVEAHDTGKIGECQTLSMGASHIAAIKPDNSLWVWGFNYDGQIGNGSTDFSEPVKILDNVVSISCGDDHTAAVKADGSLWIWGSNEKDQVGSSNGSNRYDDPIQTIPVKVMDNVVAVSCGENTTSALKTDGSLWCWGGYPFTSTPTKVMENVAAMSGSDMLFSAIKTDGTLWVWGSLDKKDPRNPGYYTRYVATYANPVKLDDNVTYISNGGRSLTYIKNDGTVWTWGSNSYGQRGIGTAEHEWKDRLYCAVDMPPTRVEGLNNAVSLNTSKTYTHVAAVLADGSLWMWGSNHNGQLGIGGRTGNDKHDDKHPIQTIPVKVMDDVTSAFCGWDATAAIKKDGTLWTWGYNPSGILGYQDYDLLYSINNLPKEGVKTSPKQVEGFEVKPSGSSGTVITPVSETVAGFADVRATDYFADAVKWALDMGITNGTGKDTFSPSDTCNTAQILTFLWRASGEPEAPEAGLADVAEGIYYYGAAQWAKSKGMISGDTLSPETPCTRASTVMYMWQAAGSPSVDTKTSFTDVPADADYAMAVAWAVENGVTTGTSSTAFSPDQTCTRGQIATFLYRAFAD